MTKKTSKTETVVETPDPATVSDPAGAPADAPEPETVVPQPESGPEYEPNDPGEPEDQA